MMRGTSYPYKYKYMCTKGQDITGLSARDAADELHAAPIPHGKPQLQLVELPRHLSFIHHAGVAEMLP